AILPASRLADIGIRQHWSNLIAILRIESKVYNNRAEENKASMRYYISDESFPRMGYYNMLARALGH
ncbi:MAG: hypothetical protein IKI28_05595, partial [Bacteroidales bacterium]|nr:hypothetical protein [Bacteroidales bacterium]